MKAFVVTGTTQGIGRAIAEAVVAAGDQLLSLSRAPNKVDGLWHNIECDLGRTASIRTNLQKLIQTVAADRVTELILINNAGVLDPIGSLEDASDEQILSHVKVNQAAPAMLMSAFIGLTQYDAARRRIINISSGAARHPYAGLAMYCGSKAALELMTLCVAAEQQHRNNPVTVCSVSPGKVETGMQRQIRQSDKAMIPSQPDFIKAREQGDLLTPGQVARMLLALDRAGEFKNGGLYDLRSTILEGRRLSIQPIQPVLL